MKVFLAVVLIILILDPVDMAKKKKKKPPPPSQKKQRIANLFTTVSDLQQNVSALWARLDQLSGESRTGGVHIHAGDGEVSHHRDEGQHLHMHMHIDSECRSHEHDGEMHERMHAHAHRRGQIHGHCQMKPNPQLPENFTSRVTGIIHLSQQHNGGPVHVEVNLSGFDVSGDHPHHIHGFHIHELGDMTNGCTSLGGHYDVTGSDHGSPDAGTRHTGDWGNIMCDDQGVVHRHFTDDHSTLLGGDSLFGRSIVLHRDQDDMGLTDNPGSKASGNAGPRIACCVIGRSMAHDEDHHREHHSTMEDQDDHDHEGHHGHH